MAGIYIHIPFCSVKCHYCNFFSTPSRRFFSAFTPALLQEITQKSVLLHGQEVETIYIGGGTPSLLPVQDILRILDHLQLHFNISPTAEISLEANPESLNTAYLGTLKHSRVNRLSIGTQSFNNKDLVFLNRAHDAQKALSSIKKAQDMGFHSLNIDLIYGIPTATDKDWEHNLRTLATIKPPHLSAYALTQEQGTAYDVQVRKRKASAPSEDSTLRQYHMLQAFLPTIAMEQYEISNYAKVGQHAIHNSHYWLGKDYLGLGPSAHSLIGQRRSWNIARMSDYIRGAHAGHIDGGSETLRLSDQWNELMLMPLRTKWGLAASEVFSARFPTIWQNNFKDQIQHYINKGWVSLQQGSYRITPQAKLMADGIAADLFVDASD